MTLRIRLSVRKSDRNFYSIGECGRRTPKRAGRDICSIHGTRANRVRGA